MLAAAAASWSSRAAARALVAGVLCASAWALGITPARAFWCEGSLVLEGDRMAAVRAACGEPASAVSRVETRSYCSCCAGRRHVGPVYGGLVTTTTTQIDVWVYDFGYTRFMEELTFENGVLTRLTRLGRGSRSRRDRVERTPDAPAPRLPLWRRDMRAF